MDVSDIFNFFCSGRGKGESEAPGGGGFDFLLKTPGGVFRRERGREGVCGELGNLGEGGANIFFGPEMSTKPLNSSEFSRNFLNFPNFAQVPPNPLKLPGNQGRRGIH